MKMRKKVTKETRSKLRKASLERRLKFGYINSPETRRKLSEINKGKKHSKDTIEKLRKIHSNRSKETRRRMSISQKGKKQSKETIRKRVMARSWYRPSEEVIQKMRDAKKGKIVLEETREKMRGKNNPHWLGGKSFEPYGLVFNDIFREKVRERDNYCCVVCNNQQEELKGVLSVHHVDYIKINNFPQNCVSLCRGCHAKTNFNRQSWKIFFQSLLKERYEYEYTQDQKIILDFNEVSK